MNNKNEIKPGMLVLWTGGRGGLIRPMKTFLGFVVAEVKEHEVSVGLRRGSRQFLVFVRTRTTQDKTVITILEHHIVPFSKEG